MSIEEMCIEAQKRIAAHINRSAGQHLRAMRLAFVQARQAAGVPA
jgi:hypothetical protein